MITKLIVFHNNEKHILSTKALAKVYLKNVKSFVHNGNKYGNTFFIKNGVKYQYTKIPKGPFQKKLIVNIFIDLFISGTYHYSFIRFYLYFNFSTKT